MSVLVTDPDGREFTHTEADRIDVVDHVLTVIMDETDQDDSKLIAVYARDHWTRARVENSK